MAGLLELERNFYRDILGYTDAQLAAKSLNTLKREFYLNRLGYVESATLDKSLADLELEYFSNPPPIGTPVNFPILNNSDYLAASTSYGSTATVTADVAPGVEGAWTELIAATSEDSDWLTIGTGQVSATANSHRALVDIAFGGAGSEVVKVENLDVGYVGAGGAHYEFPILIPAGTRISARVVSNIVSKAFPVTVRVGKRDGASGVSDVLDSMGLDLVNLTGTAIALPGAVNTKGAWTEIFAATARDYKALVLGIDLGITISISTGNVLVDVGIGPAGSEVVISPDLFFVTSSSENITWPYEQSMLIGKEIPAGTRLAIRYQYQVSSSQTIRGALYGVRA